MVITVKDPRLLIAAAALIAIGGMTTACGGRGEQAPSSTSTTTTTTSPSSAAAPAPTEKAVNPTGGNLFTPGVTASPAPNIPPGQHPGINSVP